MIIDRIIESLLEPYKYLDRSFAETVHLPNNIIPLAQYHLEWQTYAYYKDVRFKPTQRCFDYPNIIKWIDSKTGLCSAEMDNDLRWVLIQFRLLLSHEDEVYAFITTPVFSEFLEEMARERMRTVSSKRSLSAFVRFNKTSSVSLRPNSPKVQFENRLPKMRPDDILYNMVVPFYNQHESIITTNIELALEERNQDLIHRVADLCRVLQITQDGYVYRIINNSVPLMVSGYTSIISLPYIYEQITLPIEYSKLWCICDHKNNEGSFNTLPDGSPGCDNIVLALLRRLLYGIIPTPIFANRHLFVYTSDRQEHNSVLLKIFSSFSKWKITVNFTKSTWYHPGTVWEHHDHVDLYPKYW